MARPTMHDFRDPRGTDEESFQPIEPEAQQSETYIGRTNDQSNGKRCLDEVDADLKQSGKKLFSGVSKHF